MKNRSRTTFVPRLLKRRTGVSRFDAASFKALSEEYTKDKNKIFYKWISPGRFWVVELPLADAKSFEVIGVNLAKDAGHVWWCGEPLVEVDPSTVVLVNAGFVWKDARLSPGR